MHVGDVVAQFLEFGFGLATLVIQYVTDDDAGALLGEHARLDCALPPRSAADERDLPFQPGHSDASCSWVSGARIIAMRPLYMGWQSGATEPLADARRIPQAAETHCPIGGDAHPVHVGIGQIFPTHVPEIGINRVKDQGQQVPVSNDDREDVGSAQTFVQGGPGAIQHLIGGLATMCPQVGIGEGIAYDLPPVVDGARRQRAFVKPRIDVNGHAQEIRKRFGGLPRSSVSAGDDRIDRKFGQESGQFTGLALTRSGERRVRFLTCRLAVPDQYETGCHGWGYGRQRRRAPTSVKPARW